MLLAVVELSQLAQVEAVCLVIPAGVVVPPKTVTMGRAVERHPASGQAAMVARQFSSLLAAAAAAGNLTVSAVVRELPVELVAAKIPGPSVVMEEAPQRPTAVPVAAAAAAILLAE